MNQIEAEPQPRTTETIQADINALNAKLNTLGDERKRLKEENAKKNAKRISEIDAEIYTLGYKLRDLALELANQPGKDQLAGR